MFIEIKMSMTFVFGYGIDILCCGINISKLLAFEEINLSHCGYHKSSRLSTVNSLCRIVCQTICCVVYKETFLCLCH